MKRISTIAYLLITAAVVFAPAAQAQGQGGPNACTNAAVAGTYTVTCSGFTAAGSGGSLVPIMQVDLPQATPTATGQVLSLSISAVKTVIPASNVTGKANLNSDCTGTITYNKGTPTELNISYVVNPRTDETFGLVTERGQWFPAF